MEPQLFSCGLFAIAVMYLIIASLQWSRNFSVADCVQKLTQTSITKLTSMEPQLFSCGLLMVPAAGGVAGHASMEPQLFSCGLLTETQNQNHPTQSFNGAATFQLRIVLKDCHLLTATFLLQWSRNFSVAD